MNEKNRNLQRAKRVKNDEFYTRYSDIRTRLQLRRNRHNIWMPLEGEGDFRIFLII